MYVYLHDLVALKSFIRRAGPREEWTLFELKNLRLNVFTFESYFEKHLP